MLPGVMRLIGRCVVTLGDGLLGAKRVDVFVWAVNIKP